MFRRPERWFIALGAAVGVSYALIWSWALSSQTYNIYGALAIVPVVVAINLLLVAHTITRHPDEPWLPTVLVLGLVAKLVATFGRYLVAYVVYGGQADAERYNVHAAYQHKLWRQGEIVWEMSGKQGTDMMEIITTAVYTVIGGSPLAGFFVFASLAYWGAYLLYRAFRTAVPTADHRRYALLVFFLPSMLYWPSSIGKESWLMLFVGVTALGAARHFRRERGAARLLVAGAIGLTMVRPHVAVLLFAALFVAEMLRPTGGTVAGLVRKFGAFIVLGGAAVLLTRASAQFLGIDDISAQAINETIDWTSSQTQQGGSEFTPVPLSSPLGVPMAFVTLLFRPFLFEAHNAQMVMHSLEALFLLGLTVLSWSRLRQLPRMLREHPFLWFALVTVIAYSLAFAEFGNFGILARQRVLMLPFFLMLLALPKPREAIFDQRPVRPGEVDVLVADDRRLMATRR